MRRFFIDQQSINENLAILSPEESRHVATVLRLHPGDALELFDGTGCVYQGQILTVAPTRITVEILSKYCETGESAPPLYLFQGLLKGKKMDFLVQKATELGVHTFSPVLTRYSTNRANHERQQDRWKRIMLESCKQCKRTIPMNIDPVLPLEAIDADNTTSRLLLWEGERSTRIDATLVRYDSPMVLFTGPEGGFHPDEITLARKRGFTPVSLGSRILRSETATLSCIAILQFLSGALSPDHA